MHNDLNRQMSKRLIDKINEDLLKIFKQPEMGVGVSELLDIKDPIEWENEMGKFKVESENTVFFMHKSAVQFINIDFTISPSSKNNL